MAARHQWVHQNPRGKQHSQKPEGIKNKSPPGHESTGGPRVTQTQRRKGKGSSIGRSPKESQGVEAHKIIQERERTNSTKRAYPSQLMEANRQAGTRL